MKAPLYPESSTRISRLLLAISLTALVLVGLTLLLVSAQPALADGNVIYVNHAATGGNDGSTWDDAYTSLQAALDAAAYGDEIWVATGVYTPTNAVDRTATFQMATGVAIYGGFAATETLRTERDWMANITVLSGDLDGNDLADPHGVVTATSNITGSNAYHVVTGSGVTETAVLDGFTITAGQANGNEYPQYMGGGMYNDPGHPVVENVTFSANQASPTTSGGGGGMYNYFSDPTLRNVTFRANQASATCAACGGGGMYNSSSNPTLEKVTFTANQVGGTGWWIGGAGMYNDNSNPILENVIFSGNQATGVGSGSGGGAIYNMYSHPVLVNVTLAGNWAHPGSALYNMGGGSAGSNPILTKVIMWGNKPEWSAFWNEGSSNPVVNYSLVQGGYAGTGNLDADPLFVAPVDADLAPSTEGNYRLQYDSPAIDAGNTLSITAVTDLDGSPRVVGDEVDMGAYEYQLQGCGLEGRLYVNHAATGANTGLSWADAFTDLQEALANAQDCEVWVAQGVYYPGPDASDRSAAFLLRSGVQVYGGFAGTETALEQRDWETNLTILSGDLDGDDVTDPYGVVTDTANISGTNAYHVVVGSGVTETAVLDGFFLTAGQADGGTAPLNRGGGLYTYNGRPTLANLTFSANFANAQGGGLYNDLGTLALTHLTFHANRSNSDGGGLYTHIGSLTLGNSRFDGNYTGGNGGGLYNSGGLLNLSETIFEGNGTAGSFTGGGGLYTDSSDPVLTNIIFRGNHAAYGGGAHSYSGDPLFTNVLFSGNTADYGGGIYVAGGNPTFNGVTFSGNRAAWGGGGLYRSGGSPSLVNSIAWGNSASYDPQISSDGVAVTYSIVQGGYAGTGNLDADPLCVAPVDAALAPTTEGNYRLRYASPAIDAGNTLSVTVATDLDGNPRVVGDEVDMGAYEFQAYTLTVGLVGNGQVVKTPDQPDYNYLDQVALTATADPGWNFVGWSGDVVTTTNPLTLTIVGHTAITATFVADEYALEVSIVGDGAVSKEPDQPTYHYGDVVTLTATADLGWAFAGWSGDVVTTTNPLTLTIVGHTAITAAFTQDEYTLEVSIVGDGAVSKDPDQPTYHYGDVVTLTATADPGWTFAGWSGDVVTTTNPLALTIVDHTAVTATFTQDEYTLEVSIIGEGTVSKDPDQPTYHYGDVVTLTAIAEPGWTFMGWSGDIVSNTNPVTITITKNTVITATFSTYRIYLPFVIRGS